MTPSISSKHWLAPEFVTWLYFHLHREGYEIAIGDDAESFDEPAPADSPVRFGIGRKVTLSDEDGGGAKVALTGFGLDDSGETLEAVRRGAMIDVLALDVEIGSRVYEIVLTAVDGGMSVTLPDLFSEPEGEELLDGDKPKTKRPKLPFEDVLALRMGCLDEIERVVGELFARFIARRVAGAWRGEDLSEIRARIEAGQAKRRISA